MTICTHKSFPIAKYGDIMGATSLQSSNSSSFTPRLIYKLTSIAIKSYLILIPADIAPRVASVATELLDWAVFR